MLFDRRESECYSLIFNHLFDLKDQILGPITVETWFNPVCVIVRGSAEVHVHKTVVDPVVLDMDEVVVSVEVLSSVVIKPLSVAKLVINAVLENQSDRKIKSTISDSKTKY